MVRAVGPVAVSSYDPALRKTFGLGWYGVAPLALKSLLIKSLLIYENCYKAIRNSGNQEGKRKHFFSFPEFQIFLSLPDACYSCRSAFTGSSRAAKYAGIKAASEQMRNALMQMIATSCGTTWAGILENW